MKEKIKYEESSGNVFKDLELENFEELLAKADLAHKISEIIKAKKLTQKQAADILEIDQPKVSALIQGKLRSFSLERLLKFLNALGQNVLITITPSKAKNERGHTTIRKSRTRIVLQN